MIARGTSVKTHGLSSDAPDAPYDVFLRDWIEEDIGLGPDAYSRSTEEASIWGKAFGSVFRRDEPA
jgi:hypothetical protein